MPTLCMHWRRPGRDLIASGTYSPGCIQDFRLVINYSGNASSICHYLLKAVSFVRIVWWGGGLQRATLRALTATAWWNIQRSSSTSLSPLAWWRHIPRPVTWEWLLVRSTHCSWTTSSQGRWKRTFSFH